MSGPAPLANISPMQTQALTLLYTLFGSDPANGFNAIQALLSTTAHQPDSSIQRIHKFPEPKGEANRRTKGSRKGWSIQKASRLSPSNYKKMKKIVHIAVFKYMDVSRRFKANGENAFKAVVAECIRRVPWLKHFEDDWLVKAIVIQILNKSAKDFSHAKLMLDDSDIVAAIEKDPYDEKHDDGVDGDSDDETPGREADTDPNDNANGAHARILHSQEDASETSASHTMANNLGPASKGVPHNEVIAAATISRPIPVSEFFDGDLSDIDHDNASKAKEVERTKGTAVVTEAQKQKRVKRVNFDLTANAGALASRSTKSGDNKTSKAKAGKRQTDDNSRNHEGKLGGTRRSKRASASKR